MDLGVRSRRAAHGLRVCLALWLPLPGSVLAGVIYENDFQTGAGPEWSHRAISATPRPADGSRRFLGRFDNETVTLSLTPPRHGMVMIELDLYVIGTWDGSTRYDGVTPSTPWGPDRWTLTVDGTRILLDTSFSNVTRPPFKIPFLQNYPAAWASGVTNFPFTGSSEARSLGYVFDGYDASAVYHLKYCVPHTATSLVFAFSAAMSHEYGGRHNIGEESWGLDNVRVTTDTDGDLSGPDCWENAGIGR